jgi:hypothetical protein
MNYGCMQSLMDSRNKLALETHWRLDHLDEVNELFVTNAAEAVLGKTGKICTFKVYMCRSNGSAAHSQVKLRLQGGTSTSCPNKDYILIPVLFCTVTFGPEWGAGLTLSSVHHASTNWFICHRYFRHSHKQESKQTRLVL